MPTALRNLQSYMDKRVPEDLVQDIIKSGIQDRKLIAAFRRVERSFFISPEWEAAAYKNQPIPIGHDQVTRQPSVIAKMIAALKLTGKDRVLEIGTGTGYSTALLACLCREVYSVERLRDLADRARSNLRVIGIHNVNIFVNSPTLGLPAHAPYSAIIASAASPVISVSLAHQLREKGRMVVSVGPSEDETILVFQKKQGKLVLSSKDIITKRLSSDDSRYTPTYVKRT